MQPLPRLGENQQSTKMTGAFLGYNHNDIIKDGEMWDMENLSGDHYPILTQRARRGIRYFGLEHESDRLTGIHGRDQLVYFRGQRIYYNDVDITQENNAVTLGELYDRDGNLIPRKVVSMGAYVCIWPDRVYFNTLDYNDGGRIDRDYTISGATIAANMCRPDGTDYDAGAIAIGTNPPENPNNGQLWVDQSGTVDVLRYWDAISEEWQENASSYVVIRAENIGGGLKVGDVVTISGLELQAATGENIQKRRAQVEALNGQKEVFALDDDYIVVTGLLSWSIAAGDLMDKTAEANRRAPALDFICESNNRLWGCRYGLVDGQVVNEIHACKLGDFKNWYSFAGTAADSYVASVGTDGPFTGAITQRGYPVFFKEHCIHRVSGNTPASFQIATTMCRGVQRGSWRSVAVVGEAIYYKATNAVMMYDGSQPMSVSEELGRIQYSNARAGAIDSKYYISMEDEQGAWSLFVLDTKNNMWFREDSTKALGFGLANNELYFIDERGNTLNAVRGSSGTLEEYMSWGATFGMFGTDYKGQKYLSRFNIRMQMAEGSRVTMEIEYDSDGIWHDEGEIMGHDMRTFMIPVIPRRCDHLRFRIKGTGMCKIYSIARQLEVGSDG